MVISNAKCKSSATQTDAVMLLHLAEELCPKIIPKISRDWLAK